MGFRVCQTQARFASVQELADLPTPRPPSYNSQGVKTCFHFFTKHHMGQHSCLFETSTHASTAWIGAKGLRPGRQAEHRTKECGQRWAGARQLGPGNTATSARVGAKGLRPRRPGPFYKASHVHGLGWRKGATAREAGQGNTGQGMRTTWDGMKGQGQAAKACNFGWDQVRGSRMPGSQLGPPPGGSLAGSR